MFRAFTFKINTEQHKVTCTESVQPPLLLVLPITPAYENATLIKHTLYTQKHNWNQKHISTSLYKGLKLPWQHHHNTNIHLPTTTY